MELTTKEAIETYNVLSQLNDQKGLPLKFEYGVVKLVNRLEKAVKPMQVLSEKKIEGQTEYNEERVKLLKLVADKDENGNPISKATANGEEYQITDRALFINKLAKLDKKHADTLKALADRQEALKELLDSLVEDFEPYIIHVKNLPVKDGMSMITPIQMKHLMPFLDGDIDDLD